LLDCSLSPAMGGVPYCCSKAGREAASDRCIRLEPLPGNSPDLMPIKAL
jgi:hypothetical protein